MSKDDTREDWSSSTRVDAWELRSPEEPAVREGGARLFRMQFAGEELLVLSVPLAAPKCSTLTKAERRVARELVRGRSNAQIAAAHGTSVRTVANQVAAILRRTGAGSRSEAAVHLADANLASDGKPLDVDCGGGFSPIGVIEQAYEIETTDDEWLTGILARIAPGLDRGFGVYAWRVAPGGKVATPRAVNVGLSVHVGLALLRLQDDNEQHNPAVLRQVHTPGPLQLESERLALTEDQARTYPPVVQRLHPLGVADILGLR